MSDASKSAARENDEEFRRVKDDFLRVARQHKRRELSTSESSRSPSPIRRRSSRRSKNLSKFKIAPFYANDVELWFNQLETQFDLHDITDDDERYRLTCADLSGEVASDIKDILLQPFLSHKYISLKGVLIERRGLRKDVPIQTEQNKRIGNQNESNTDNSRRVTINPPPIQTRVGRKIHTPARFVQLV